MKIRKERCQVLFLVSLEREREANEWDPAVIEGSRGKLIREGIAELYMRV